MFETIQYKIRDRTATIILNRPQSLNSMNLEMVRELFDVMEKIKRNADLRCIVLTGAGRGFCAGADLSSRIMNSPAEIAPTLKTGVNPVIKAIKEMNIPVIAAVNGTVAGAGCGIALACDLVVAKESAEFFLAFVSIGMVPDAGISYFLPRLVGVKKAMELTLLGEKISAGEALRMGMINSVISDNKFEVEVEKLASRLSSGPLCQNMIKTMFSSSLDRDLNECLEIEAVFQGKVAMTEDAAEGINAFLEKRKPVFKGR